MQTNVSIHSKDIWDKENCPPQLRAGTPGRYVR